MILARADRELRAPVAELRDDATVAKHLGVELDGLIRECSVTDAETLTGWLAEHVAPVERREDRVREQLLRA
jgi:hypothetical protein